MFWKENAERPTDLLRPVKTAILQKGRIRKCSQKPEKVQGLGIREIDRAAEQWIQRSACLNSAPVMIYTLAQCIETSIVHIVR